MGGQPCTCQSSKHDGTNAAAANPWQLTCSAFSSARGCDFCPDGQELVSMTDALAVTALAASSMRCKSQDVAKLVTQTRKLYAELPCNHPHLVVTKMSAPDHCRCLTVCTDRAWLVALLQGWPTSNRVTLHTFILPWQRLQSLQSDLPRDASDSTSWLCARSQASRTFERWDGCAAATGTASLQDYVPTKLLPDAAGKTLLLQTPCILGILPVSSDDSTKTHALLHWRGSTYEAPTPHSRRAGRSALGARRSRVGTTTTSLMGDTSGLASSTEGGPRGDRPQHGRGGGP